MSDSPATRFDYDAEMFRYHPRFMAALDIQPTDHVLDIGCGAGQTTRDAARAASYGTVLGVDVSELRLDIARRLTREAGQANVSFLCADVQTHRFPDASFDLAISRFGTMFFADPPAAFANIAGSLRTGSPLVQLVWQASEHQEWTAALDEVFGRQTTPAQSANAFSLAEADVVEELMSDAGFEEIEFVDLREPVYYGRDAESALHAILLLKMTQERLAPLDDESAASSIERLRAVLRAHETGAGVLFGSAAWLITARTR